MNNEAIQLIQSPIIHHNLVLTGKSVTERIENLNLENQVATDETLQTLKKLRTELNNEAKNFEDQRKTIKNAVLEPYNEFESAYKTEILEKYKAADNVLKDKISDYEMSIKKQKKENLEKYFNELCEMEQIDWLEFDKLGIEVNLSTTEKKYKVEILGTIQKIADDINLIKTETYAAEIILEYKNSLNASQAIQMVRQKKLEEKAEAERLLNQRTDKRTARLRSLAFTYHDLTRTYNWANDEKIMVSHSDVESLSEGDWFDRITDLKSKTILKHTTPILKAPTLSVPVQETTQQPQQTKIEETFEAKFIVTGTYNELKALSEFLKSNNYKYKNID